MISMLAPIYLYQDVKTQTVMTQKKQSKIKVPNKHGVSLPQIHMHCIRGERVPIMQPKCTVSPGHVSVGAQACENSLNVKYCFMSMQHLKTLC